MKTFLAYLRCSTKKKDQSLDGYSFDSQFRAIEQYVAGIEGGVIGATYTDQESGSNNQRDGLRRCLEHAKRVGGTIVVNRLDRLSRSLTFISQLCDSGIPFVVAEMPSATPLMISIYACMAQEEKLSIQKRVRAGMLAAKLRGRTFGAPDKVAAVQNMNAGARRAKEDHKKVIYPIVEELRSVGVNTLQALCDALNRRGYLTRRNKLWSPSSLRLYLA